MIGLQKRNRYWLYQLASKESKSFRDKIIMCIPYKAVQAWLMTSRQTVPDLARWGGALVTWFRVERSRPVTGILVWGTEIPGDISPQTDIHTSRIMIWPRPKFPDQNNRPTYASSILG